MIAVDEPHYSGAFPRATATLQFECSNRDAAGGFSIKFESIVFVSFFYPLAVIAVKWTKTFFSVCRDESKAFTGINPGASTSPGGVRRASMLAVTSRCEPSNSRFPHKTPDLPLERPRLADYPLLLARSRTLTSLAFSPFGPDSIVNSTTSPSLGVVTLLN